jgi:hypothetical protein
MRWEELSRMNASFFPRETIYKRMMKAKDKPRVSVFIIYFAFSVVFQHSVYILAASSKKASLPGITACMGCVKKQVTELKQKNVYCRAREYLKDA